MKIETRKKQLHIKSIQRNIQQIPFVYNYCADKTCKQRDDVN